jgi:hypothetical protein
VSKKIAIPVFDTIQDIEDLEDLPPRYSMIKTGSIGEGESSAGDWYSGEDEDSGGAGNFVEDEYLGLYRDSGEEVVSRKGEDSGEITDSWSPTGVSMGDEYSGLYRDSGEEDASGKDEDSGEDRDSWETYSESEEYMSSSSERDINIQDDFQEYDKELQNAFNEKIASHFCLGSVSRIRDAAKNGCAFCDLIFIELSDCYPVEDNELTELNICPCPRSANKPLRLYITRRVTNGCIEAEITNLNRKLKLNDSEAPFSESKRA